MLIKMEALNSAGDLLTLVLDDASDGLVLKEVGGLGPVKATIVSSRFASLPGAQYHSSSRETRNVVISIELQPDYVSTSVQDLRMMLYDFFMPDDSVTLTFYDSVRPTVKTSGSVETCEPTIFAKEPSMTISVICFDPDLLPLDSETVSDVTVSDTSETTVPYDGNIKTGYELELDVDRDLAEFSVYTRAPDGTVQTMNFVVDLVADDVVKIGTVQGNKYVTLTRASVTTSILYAKTSPGWPKLAKGDNKIRVYAIGTAIPWTLTYLPRYGGL